MRITTVPGCLQCRTLRSSLTYAEEDLRNALYRKGIKPDRLRQLQDSRTFSRERLHQHQIEVHAS